MRPPSASAGSKCLRTTCVTFRLPGRRDEIHAKPSRKSDARRGASAGSGTSRSRAPDTFIHRGVPTLPVIHLGTISTGRTTSRPGYGRRCPSTIATGSAWFLQSPHGGMMRDPQRDEPALLLPPPSPIRFVSADLLQSLLDALPDHVVLVDAAGGIGAANEAWRRFAEANGVQGASYPEACRAACGDRYAAEVLDGVRRVSNGDVGEFSLRYPGAGVNGPAWYEVRATR